MAAIAAIIFLHGSGDTGPGVKSYLAHVAGGRLLKAAKQHGIAMHFPSATPRPYRLAGGSTMSVWFDRYALEPSAPEHTESVEASCAQLDALVDSVVATGVPASRIAIGGFSMGGGIALQCMLRSPHRSFAACFALSSFLCDEAAVYRRIGPSAVPIFMRHGDADDFILSAWGQATATKLTSHALDVDFATVPGLAHELGDDEINELTDWLLPKLLQVPAKEPVGRDEL